MRISIPILISKLLATPFFYLWIKPKAHGKKGVKIVRPTILIHNHISYWDPCVVNMFFPSKNVRFMTTQRMFEYHWFVSWIVRKLGAFPVQRGAGKSDETVKKCVDMLEGSTVLVIAPEGHIYTDGALHTFRTGAVRIALESGADILPMYIKNRKSWWGRTHVCFGEKINLKEKYKDEALDADAIFAIADKLRRDMAECAGGYGFKVPLAERYV